MSLSLKPPPQKKRRKQNEELTCYVALSGFVGCLDVFDLLQHLASGQALLHLPIDLHLAENLQAIHTALMRMLTHVDPTTRDTPILINRVNISALSAHFFGEGSFLNFSHGSIFQNLLKAP